MTIDQIGRYEIIDELARGGMGVIYLANDPYVHRQVVVKVLTFQYTDDSVYHEFFQKEAEIIAALEHPNIVPVYDFGWHGKQPYIVMRYMAGGTLNDRLNTSAWPKLTEIAHTFTRVAEALDAAHARKVIHRDVKPSNILFDSIGEPFLADFGIAKSADLTDEAVTWFVGTPAYMSPEQVCGDELSGQSDVYGLGVVLFQLLSGQLPFRGGAPEEMANAHIYQPVPNLLEIKPGLLPAWGEIIEKAMAKQAQDRYPTASELARDVGEVASGRWYLRKL